ncbi:MAG: hypothetical protein JNL58_11075 [Planctomyces sp.]|nr:hypothetical protein [Planctomyces sp.]
MVTHEPALNEWLNIMAGCPIVGAEASIKLSARRICTDRLLAAVERRSLDWSQLRELCESMKLREDDLAPFSRAFEEANQVGFGIEVEQSRVVYKLYFEFWDRLVREIRSDPRNVTPRPLHLGLKWEPSAPGKVTSATYTCFPLLSIIGIQDRLTAFQDSNSISMRTTQAIMSRTAPRLRSDSFIYLEAGEESTKRRSYDLNFYKAKCRVAEVLDILDSARAAYGLPAQATWQLESASNHLLGHIGGGQGRDGHDYLTIYYEIDRIPAGV